MPDTAPAWWWDGHALLLRKHVFAAFASKVNARQVGCSVHRVQHAAYEAAESCWNVCARSPSTCITHVRIIRACPCTVQHARVQCSMPVYIMPVYSAAGIELMPVGSVVLQRASS